MYRLSLFIGIIVCFCSCEKSEEYIFPDTFLEVSSELTYDGDIYYYTYPIDQTNDYIPVDFLTNPQERVYWSSPDLFYVQLMNGDTVWDPVVNFSTYADDQGLGKQMVYVNSTLIGDTLNIIGTITTFEGDEIIDEILIKIE